MTTTDLQSEALSTIRQRRTVDLALLSAEPVPRPVLRTVLEAANWAPSHGHTEPWRFVVFTGTGRSRLSRVLATSAARLRGLEVAEPEVLKAQLARQALAPVWIAVAVEPAEKPKMPLYEEQWAVACAVQNLMLAARSLGLASKWISNAPSLHPQTASALGFADTASMMGLLYLGYLQDPEDGWPVSSRRPLEEKVRWVEE